MHVFSDNIAYGIAAAHMWNSLLSDVTILMSCRVFKRKLKMLLFKHFWIAASHSFQHEAVICFFFIFMCCRSVFDSMASSHICNINNNKKKKKKNNNNSSILLRVIGMNLFVF